MSTTYVSPLPIVFGDSSMITSDAKTKKMKNGGVGGTKQCGSCGGFAKNNKQNNCHHCEKKGLVIKNWLKKKKTKSTGRGLVCPRQGCGWSTKGNRTHNCKKCGAAFPSKGKRKAYVLTGKRKKRSENSTVQKRKKKKVNTTPTFSPRTRAILGSPKVTSPANESRGQKTSFEIDFEKIFDEPIAEFSGENTHNFCGFSLDNGLESFSKDQHPGPAKLTRGNSWTPISQKAVEEPIELSSGLFDDAIGLFNDSIGPVELNRDSSLTPLAKENSMEPIAFDYSGIDIPNSVSIQNVYESEDSAISDFSAFFNNQEVTV